jgi:hypothetical protein
MNTVSRTASGKIRQNDGGYVRLQGIAIVAEALAKCERSRAHFAAQVLPDLQGKSLCGKEAFLLT